MTTQHNPAAAFSPQLSPDWNLISNTLSSAAGVLIGLVIANFLGWF
jgi:hypothetical protein